MWDEIVIPRITILGAIPERQARPMRVPRKSLSTANLWRTEYPQAIPRHFNRTRPSKNILSDEIENLIGNWRVPSDDDEFRLW